MIFVLFDCCLNKSETICSSVKDYLLLAILYKMDVNFCGGHSFVCWAMPLDEACQL